MSFDASNDIGIFQAGKSINFTVTIELGFIDVHTEKGFVKSLIVHLSCHPPRDFFYYESFYRVTFPVLEKLRHIGNDLFLTFIATFTNLILISCVSISSTARPSGFT